MTGAQTSAGPGDPADDATDELQRPRPNVVQISTYTPPPGADVGIRSQASYGGPVVFARRVHPWRMLLLVAVVGGLLGVGGVWVYRAVERAQHRTEASAPAITTAAAPTTVATPTAGTPAPATLPPTGSLYEAGMAPLIAPAIEAAAPGEPSQFTGISIYPAYAVATVRDPVNATRTIRLTIRGADVVDDEPVTQAVDLTPSLFTAADVDWSLLTPLVADATAAAGVATDAVDHVEILRWGFDPAFPMRMLVYLDDGRFVEAAADGTVIAVH